jgi:hypothetical protein
MLLEGSGKDPYSTLVLYFWEFFEHRPDIFERAACSVYTVQYSTVFTSETLVAIATILDLQFGNRLKAGRSQEML